MANMLSPGTLCCQRNAPRAVWSASCSLRAPAGRASSQPGRTGGGGAGGAAPLVGCAHRRRSCLRPVEALPVNGEALHSIVGGTVRTWQDKALAPVGGALQAAAAATCRSAPVRRTILALVRNILAAPQAECRGEEE